MIAVKNVSYPNFCPDCGIDLRVKGNVREVSEEFNHCHIENGLIVDEGKSDCGDSVRAFCVCGEFYLYDVRDDK